MLRSRVVIKRSLPLLHQARSFTSLIQTAVETAAVGSTEKQSTNLWASSSSSQSPPQSQHHQQSPPDRRHLIVPDDLSSWTPLPTPTRPPSQFLPPSVTISTVDPFSLVAEEVNSLNGDMLKLVESDHPLLAKVARYFFEIQGGGGGKKVRPVMVLLMSHALNATTTSPYSSPTPAPHAILPNQLRLAEIAEMIHTASLFHDDVIDKSDKRRGVPTVNKVFGNKLAILAGDFLLSRASISLARLRDLEVVEVMSTVIEHLVKGEVMQMKIPTNISSEDNNSAVKEAKMMEYYLKKNHYKTGSLMANSCMSTALLNPNHSYESIEAAYLYGKHIGSAFQLVDDVLDFEGDSSLTGKATLGDLREGISTAPVLFAAMEYPHMYTLMSRKFSGPGDVDEALTIINKSGGVQMTKELARAEAEIAVDAVMRLQPSVYRDALVHLAHKVITRTS